MVANRPRWAHLALLASLCASPLAAACIDPTVVGGGEGGAAGSGGPGSGATGGSGAAPVDCSQVSTFNLEPRGLTRAQFANTVRDLLGIQNDVTADFPEDERGPDGFRQGPKASASVQQHYLDAAAAVADLAIADMPALLGCDPVTVGEDACAQQLVDGLGPRAFRRPLVGNESANLYMIYATAKGSGTFELGIRALVEALLSDKRFVYRIESTTPGEPDGIAPVPPYELATRLSYFLWDSMPDADLFAAAASGELATPEGVEAQAQRLLADPRAAAAVSSFHLQWLNLDRGGYPSEDDKDLATFPQFTDELMGDMKLELARFAQHVVLEGDGKLETLLGSTAGFVDDQLAAIYGLPAVGGDDLVLVDLPPERTGILTRAAFLTVHAGSNRTSPTLRGMSIRRALLCQDMPPPPANVDVTIPPFDDGAKTLREHLEEATADPACLGCHVLMDPIGFGFEGFDGIGRVQSSDHGLPIDDTGEVHDDAGSTPFAGATELSQLLAGNPVVSDCVASKWFRYALGVDDPASETCLQQAFAASGHDVRALMVSVALSGAFRFRPTISF